MAFWWHCEELNTRTFNFPTRTTGTRALNCEKKTVETRRGKRRTSENDLIFPYSAQILTLRWIGKKKNFTFQRKRNKFRRFSGTKFESSAWQSWNFELFYRQRLTGTANINERQFINGLVRIWSLFGCSPAIIHNYNHKLIIYVHKSGDSYTYTSAKLVINCHFILALINILLNKLGTT